MTTSLEDRLRTDLAQVATSTPVPAPPTLTHEPSPAVPAGRPSRRRWAIAAVAIAATSAVGIPVAAAAGMLPGVDAAFGWTHTGHVPGAGPGFVAKDSTGRLVLTTKGPGGQPMQLYADQAQGGGQCVTLLLPQQTGPQRVAAAECSITTGSQGLANGGGETDALGGFEILFAPGATHLTLSDGTTTRMLPAADGLSGVWLAPSDLGRPLTLTSYGPSGAQLGQITINEAKDTTAPPRPAHTGRAATPGGKP